MRAAVLLALALLALALAACQPAPRDCHCAAAVRTDAITGEFDHAMELEDGTRTEPVAVTLLHDEGWLYAYGSTGAGPRLLFRVEARFEAIDDPTACCGLRPSDAPPRPPTLRSHCRVDWGQELAAVAARARFGGVVEPVSLEVDADAPPRVQITRDTAGALVAVEAVSAYWLADEERVVTVRHVLTRRDPLFTADAGAG